MPTRLFRNAFYWKAVVIFWQGKQTLGSQVIIWAPTSQTSHQSKGPHEKRRVIIFEWYFFTAINCHQNSWSSFFVPTRTIAITIYCELKTRDSTDIARDFEHEYIARYLVYVGVNYPYLQSQTKLDTHYRSHCRTHLEKMLMRKLNYFDGTINSIPLFMIQKSCNSTVRLLISIESRLEKKRCTGYIIPYLICNFTRHTHVLDVSWKNMASALSSQELKFD